MKGEVQKCIDAKVSHLHVDVFDGVYLDSPHALTFGPQMVDAIKKRFANYSELVLDIHLCVDRPARYATAMSEAGASRIIFMFEALSLNDAVELAQTITSLGMRCGVSINPDTSVSEIYPLLETGLVDLVDILAVEPGFGGQEFNPVSEQKIKDLRQWQQKQLSESGIDIKILVDGGINSKTIKRVIKAGANIVVVGTAIFRHKDGFSAALQELNSF
jgi:ribulose-phosphate 3-epimerase